jgi:aldose 1-epimerase
VAGHRIQILADEYTPVGPDLAHTGTRRAVTGLANDFRRPAELGSRLGDLSGQHGDTYLLRERRPPGPVARVFEPGSGRVLDVSTTEPCLQLYTGVSLDGTVIGKRGRPYGKFAGLCLECHGYPAAPHFPEFPSITLRPGQTYWQETRYRFGTAATREFPGLVEAGGG